MKKYLLSLALLVIPFSVAHAAPQQRTFELSCPAGSSPAPSGVSYNPSTNKYRAYMCVDANGLETWNDAVTNGGGGGITPTPTPALGQLAVFSGAASAAGEPAILYVDQFAGADWGLKLKACIAALPATGGTCDARGIAPGTTATNPFSTYTVPVKIIFSTGKYTSTANWTFNAVADSGGLKQAAVTIDGNGTTRCGFSCVQTGTILDFTSASGIAHLIATGFGNLEISRVNLGDDSGGAVPLLQTTCTNLNLHDNTFYGSKIGNSADQDGIVLGTTSFVGVCSATTGQYGGYGSIIEHNYFYQLRRWVHAETFVNQAEILRNYSPAIQGGGFLNGPAIDIDGGANGGHGIIVEDNIIETGNIAQGAAAYTYGIRDASSGNYILRNGIWDENGVTASNATCSSTTETVTLSGANTFAVGQHISVTSMTPASWNATDVALTAVNPTGPSTVSFTAASCGGYSAYVSGGTADETAAGIKLSGSDVVDTYTSPGAVPVVATGTFNYYDNADGKIELGNASKLAVGFNTTAALGNNISTCRALLTGLLGDLPTANTGCSLIARDGVFAIGDYAQKTASLQGARSFFASPGGGNAPASPFGAVEVVIGVDGTGAPFGGQDFNGMAFQMGFSGGGLRHWIRTRHAGGADPNNAFDFFVNTAATAIGSNTPGTGNILAATLNQDGVKTPAVAFSALDACAAPLEGTIKAINDSTTTTWGDTITGGMTSHVLAYCDGTNWTVAGK